MNSTLVNTIKTIFQNNKETLKKFITLIVFMVPCIFAQYSPYEGSFYYSLDFGPGFISGDINKYENRELENLNLHLYKNNEWIDIKYTYGVGDLRLNIGYFVKEKLMLAFNGECKFVNQTISGTNFSGIVLSQGNFGLMMGYNFLGMARIQIYPNVSANYSVGKLYRIASSENGTYNSVEIKEHVEKMNNGKIVNAFQLMPEYGLCFFQSLAGCSATYARECNIRI